MKTVDELRDELREKLMSLSHEEQEKVYLFMQMIKKEEIDPRVDNPSKKDFED
jgi:hypothetical protein